MPTHPYRTEEEVLDGLRRRSPGAFEAFFDLYADRIYGFGLKVTGSPETARAILSDTFSGTLRGLKQIKSARSVPRAMFRAAVSACLAREKSNGKVPPGRTDDLLSLGADGTAAPLHDWSLDADEEARRPEEKRVVLRSVAGLPLEDRLALVLRDMEEVSDQEAAEILHVSLATLKGRLRRARLFLRQELTRHLDKEIPPGDGSPS